MLHKSDVKELTKLITRAFYGVSETFELDPAFRVITRSAYMNQPSFKFVFFPGQISDVYGLIQDEEAEAIGRRLKEVLFEVLGDEYPLRKFEYKVEEAEERDGLPDFYITGKFSVKASTSKAGRASDFGEVDIRYRGDQRNNPHCMNPRRSNPASAATLIALGIGFMLGKSK